MYISDVLALGLQYVPDINQPAARYTIIVHLPFVYHSKLAINVGVLVVATSANGTCSVISNMLSHTALMKG